MKEVEEKAQWDKRKILIFLIASLILLAVGYELKTITLGSNKETVKSNYQGIKTDVKGISIESENPASDIKRNIQEQVNTLKNEVQNINLADIATSSPQVKKVINDIKAIQNYPSTQLKEACEKICNGL